MYGRREGTTGVEGDTSAARWGQWSSSPPPQRAAQIGTRPAGNPAGGHVEENVRPEDRPTYDSGGSVKESVLVVYTDGGEAHRQKEGDREIAPPPEMMGIHHGQLVPLMGEESVLTGAAETGRAADKQVGILV